MSKVVIVTDLHLDKDTLGVPRAPEIERALTKAVEHAVMISADAFLCLGDIANPDTGGPSKRATATVIQAALRLSTCRIPSIWIAGNHDVENDGSGATTLTPMLPITGLHMVNVVEEPRLVMLNNDLAIACLPYTAVARAYDPAKEFRRMAALVGKRKVMVAAHLMVPGIVPGEETLEMPRGRDVMFPVEETTGASFRCNGHYHRRQDFDPGDGGSPIHIPGAPVPFAFGEEGNPSVFSVVTL